MKVHKLIKRKQLAWKLIKTTEPFSLASSELSSVYLCFRGYLLYGNFGSHCCITRARDGTWSTLITSRALKVERVSIFDTTPSFYFAPVTRDFYFNLISCNFILFCFVLFYFILFYFILFYFILFRFVSFRFVSFRFILFYFILFYFILFFMLFFLFHFISFYFILFRLFCYALFFFLVSVQRRVGIQHGAPLVACRTGAIFLRFQASGGERESRATGWIFRILIPSCVTRAPRSSRASRLPSRSPAKRKKKIITDIQNNCKADTVVPRYNDVPRDW